MWCVDEYNKWASMENKSDWSSLLDQLCIPRMNYAIKIDDHIR
jgi:hypothetical protein